MKIEMEAHDIIVALEEQQKKIERLGGLARVFAAYIEQMVDKGHIRRESFVAINALNFLGERDGK